VEGRCNGGLQRSAGARLPGRARTRLPGGEGRPDDLPVADRQARTPCVQAQGQVAGASRLALARRGRRRSWRLASGYAMESRPDDLPVADHQARAPCVQAQGRVAGASCPALARRGRGGGRVRSAGSHSLAPRPSASEGTPGGLPVAARQCLPARSASGGPMQRRVSAERRGAAAWAGANAPASGGNCVLDQGWVTF
jgi:hypothetical protein